VRRKSSAPIGRYTYAYANGKTCDGAAQVRSAIRGGETPIAGVRALNGC
jgi:hypothetical protein